MMRHDRAPGGRPLALLALASLLLTLGAPAALADHVFSHRLYVVGRVLDVEGRPAAGVPVNLTFLNLSASGKCFDSKPETTGPRGDYEICRHAHVIPSNASVVVEVAGETRRAGIDPDLRHARASLHLGTGTTHDLGGERHFARTFHVTGRAFALLPSSTNAEGVEVSATPILDNVTVDLHVLDRSLASGVATPDEHGQYRIDLAVGEIPAAAVVTVRVGPDRSEEAASTVFRRADVNVVRDLRLIGGPGDDAPGSSPTPAPLALLALTALCVAAARRRRPPR